MPTPYRRIEDRDSAAGLAHHLLSASRDRPAAVVTIPDQANEPYIDVAELAAAVGDFCEVYLVPTGALTWAIAEIMPEMTQVYGGAGRVYPTDLGWITDPYTAPLRFAFGTNDGPAATEKLIGDAMGAAGRGVLTVQSVRPAGREAAAQVRRLIPPSRAFVELDDGGVAALWTERIAPSCTVDQVVAVGMRVTGRYDAQSGQFQVAGSMVVPPAQAVHRYTEGMVVLVRVGEVLADRAGVDLVPGLRATVHRDDVTDNPIDRMTSLVSPGEVLVARVQRVGRPGGSTWRLTMIDIDDDEVVELAPSLLEDGPPWLREDMIGATALPAAGGPGMAVPASGREPFVVPKPGPPGVARASAVNPAAAVPEPPAALEPAHTATDAPGMAAAGAGAPAGTAADQPVPAHLLLGRLAEAEARISDLEVALARLRSDHARLAGRVDTTRAVPRPGATGDSHDAELQALRHERDSWLSVAQNQEAKAEQAKREATEQRTQLRHARQETQQLKKQIRSTTAGSDAVAPGRFVDAEEQFRWEVEQAWVQRIPAAEKARLPLCDYVIGPNFLGTLAGFDDQTHGKVVEVVVDIATGRVHSLRGRDTHQMRTSAAPGSPYRTREDGATCWRVAVQINTPGARRLHFWQPPGGAPPELSSVRHHDDDRP